MKNFCQIGKGHRECFSTNLAFEFFPLNNCISIEFFHQILIGCIKCRQKIVPVFYGKPLRMSVLERDDWSRALSRSGLASLKYFACVWKAVKVLNLLGSYTPDDDFVLFELGEKSSTCSLPFLFPPFTATFLKGDIFTLHHVTHWCEKKHTKAISIISTGLVPNQKTEIKP